MKFGKSLSNQIEETLPEWRDQFLSYKELKKRLKLIGGGDERAIKRRRFDECSDRTVEEAELTTEEADFIRLLEAELEKFNVFFEEKEEEYVIRQKELQERVVAAAEEFEEELMKVRKEIVDFHGEMVLLENYSALNYTGLVKILKKYDKRTGALIRLPFIQKVLQQPFFTTDVLYKLVKECESMLDSLLPARAAAATDPSIPPASDNSDRLAISEGGVPELEEIEYMESHYLKSTVSALKVLKEIRRGSSTVSVFSLPPLPPAEGHGGIEESWTKVPILEQVAK
ncbi:SPX domain-containing protein 2 [Acorus gramineus]|uniref:SPX domain-containing protein 2 n=1 Tax=Acorus gramineus TaxID=55184 RepID=A0AAV9A5L8_ACOGR|nr:SPX domain-containing protein 2 [Acorus gramineus]